MKAHAEGLGNGHLQRVKNLQAIALSLTRHGPG